MPVGKSIVNVEDGQRPKSPKHLPALQEYFPPPGDARGMLCALVMMNRLFNAARV